MPIENQVPLIQQGSSENQGNPVKTKVTIIIGICSCHRYGDKRDAIRETWLACLPEGMKAVFFVGDGNETSERDIILLHTRDDRDALPRKVQAFFQYALAHYEFDYLFKCDDDTYVVGERLLGLIENTPQFVGSSDWWPSHADGGAGYLLSAKAVGIVAHTLCPETGPEDVWVTESLRNAGIDFLPSPRLLQGCKTFPQDNDIITAHWCHPEVLREIHRGIVGTEDNPAIVTFWAEHPEWQSSFKLLQNGIFLGGVGKPHGRWEFLNKGDTLVIKWFDWPHEVLHKTESGYIGEKLTLKRNVNTANK